jgi:hypothetical protein
MSAAYPLPRDYPFGISRATSSIQNYGFFSNKTRAKRDISSIAQVA